MNVTLHHPTPAEPGQPVSGPADLAPAGPGSLVVVRGTAERERASARWANALGSAVVRGASVRRLA